MQLSRHFPLHELTKSSTALRLGINNDLQPDRDPAHARIVTNLKDLCEFLLEPIRVHFGKPFVPNSGYRCFALEKVLCASPIVRFLNRDASATVLDYLAGKQHPTGRAADIEVPGVRNLDLAKWIRDNLVFDQLILEFYNYMDPTSGWVHVSWNGENNRNQVLTITGGGTTKGLPDK